MYAANVFRRGFGGRFARNVYAVGGGMSVAGKGRPDVTAEEQIVEAVRMLFDSNDLKLSNRSELRNFQGLVQSAYFSDHFENQLLMGAIVQDAIGWNPVGGWRIEAGGATGGSAVQAAALAVASGVYDYALVLAWGKMSEVSTAQGVDFVAKASDTDFEYEAGGNYAGYYAMMAQEIREVFKVRPEQIAKVSVKNRNQAQFNPFAQTSNRNPFATGTTSGFIRLQEVLGDKRPSCSPLHVLDCSLMTDSASALLLCSEELAHKLTDHPVRLVGMGAGSDTMRTGDRKKEAGSLTKIGAFIPHRNLLFPHEAENPEIVRHYETLKYPQAHSFLAGRVAALAACEMAGISDPREALSWLEIHDAFASAEIQAVEEFGLAPFGQGGKLIDSALFDELSGKFTQDFPAFFAKPEFPVYLNLSGGLIGNRHAIGDSGVAQTVDLIWRMQGKIHKFYGPDAFQPSVVAGTKAAVHSHAGTGAFVAISVWERPADLPTFAMKVGEPHVCDEMFAKIRETQARALTGVRSLPQHTRKSDILSADDSKLSQVRYRGAAGASIIKNEEHIQYFHSRGRISPFFDHLGEGRLLATYCSKHGIHMAPIAFCRESDCLEDISENWVDLKHVPARLQTWTTMRYAGPMFADDLPFHTVLVEWPEIAATVSLVDVATGQQLGPAARKVVTSLTSRLKLPAWFAEKDIFVGMPLQVCFNTQNPKGRFMDHWFAPAFTEEQWRKLSPTNE